MLTSLILSVFAIIQQEELMGWHLSGAGYKNARIRVIGVNFSEFLIKGKEISSSQRGIQVSLFELTR